MEAANLQSGIEVVAGYLSKLKINTTFSERVINAGFPESVHVKVSIGVEKDNGSLKLSLFCFLLGHLAIQEPTLEGRIVILSSGSNTYKSKFNKRGCVWFYEVAQDNYQIRLKPESDSS